MNEFDACVTHSYCPWWELGEMGVVELVAAERGSTPAWSGHYVHHSMYSVGMTVAMFVI